ncbi:MAG: hypothetical protein JNK11_20115 [Alphaproteobacteria bacterium]|nr:hypothetical protein [Alphaproteobacteria bacterium]
MTLPMLLSIAWAIAQSAPQFVPFAGVFGPTPTALGIAGVAWFAWRIIGFVGGFVSLGMLSGGALLPIQMLVTAAATGVALWNGGWQTVGPLVERLIQKL